MSRPFANESVFRAIAHQARRQILDHLRRREMTVSELAETMKISLRNLSPHLRVLRTTGLVAQRRRGNYRYYTLSPNALRQAIAWLTPFGAAGRHRGGNVDSDVHTQSR